jgi:hypothetical protein
MNARNHRRLPRMQRRAALAVEPLETRQVLSTLYVVPHGAPTDTTHFADLAAAVTAAQPGDLVQVEPGSDLPSFTPTTVAVTARPGDTQVTTNGPVAPGLIVTLGIPMFDRTTFPEPVLVVAQSAGPNSTFVLTLAKPLAWTHAAGVDVYASETTVGITRTVAIQGDPAAAMPAVPSMEVFRLDTGIVQGVVVQSVNVPHLILDEGDVGTIVHGAHLGYLSALGRGTVVTGNSIDFGLTLSGGFASNDLIENNTFHGQLKVQGEGSAQILANTIDVVQVSNQITAYNINDAVDIQFSDDITLANNTITFHTNAVNPPDRGMAIFVDDGGVPSPIRVNLFNNDVSTLGQGLGILTHHEPSSGQFGSDLQVRVEGNDLHANRVGLYAVGDGSTGADAAGTIDAGGGPLGSRGGNNFRGFTNAPADLNAGRFALYLTNQGQNAGSITAQHNIWSVSDPNTVVKDADSNHQTGGSPDGDGSIDVGTAQLDINHQFVQSLYHDFLGRTADQGDLDAWVALLPSVGRPGIANAIARSPEGLTRVVDALFFKFLDRPADVAGEANAVSFLEQGGTEEQLTTLLLASPEYYLHARALVNPAQPDAAWLAALYRQLLGRTATDSEINGWLAVLPGVGRSGVAAAFLASTEYRSDVVASYYTDLLHRTAPAPPAELTAWATSRYDLLTIKVGFAGSDEFLANG